ncbi:hypothetical protein [Candidatus Odyssella thessalonicensis]|uniref:hypothetical protein n=1 Tax=Candidatus Odyssella thessalonicensis TaxID=84647 RepID=UPI000225A989|nr:hypothetical protein [Candidatus Odyssella thessalonicensis]
MYFSKALGFVGLLSLLLIVDGQAAQFFPPLAKVRDLEAATKGGQAFPAPTPVQPGDLVVLDIDHTILIPATGKNKYNPKTTTPVN